MSAAPGCAVRAPGMTKEGVGSAEAQAIALRSLPKLTLMGFAQSVAVSIVPTLTGRASPSPHMEPLARDYIPNYILASTSH